MKRQLVYYQLIQCSTAWLIELHGSQYQPTYPNTTSIPLDPHYQLDATSHRYHYTTLYITSPNTTHKITVILNPILHSPRPPQIY